MKFLKTLSAAVLAAFLSVSLASAAEADVNVGGTYHKATSICVYVSSTCHAVQSVWAKVGSSWVQVYGAFTPYSQTVYGAATPLNAFTTGSLTVPTGASHVIVKLQTSGGPGCAADVCGGSSVLAGGGGGYVVYTISLTSSDWGKSIAYSLHNRTYTFSDSGYGFSYEHDSATCSFTNGTMSLSAVTGGRGYDGPAYSSGSASGGNTSNTAGGSASSTQGGSAGNGTAGATSGQGAPGAGGGPQTTTGYGGEAYIEVDWS